MPSAFRGIADGVIALDPDQRCTYVNEAAAAYLKTSPAEALGRVIWETFPALQDSPFREGLARAARKKVFVKLEEYCEPPGKWLEFRCHPTEEGLLVLINDITSHKRIEEVMLESRQALEMAITGSNAGIWRIDLNPEKPGEMPDYAYLSPRLKALLGFDSGEFPNSRSAWQDRIPPEDMPRVQEAIRAHLEGRTEIYEVDYRIRHKDGSLRWFNSRGKLFRDEFNRPIRWAGVDTDVTEQKLAAEVLRDREERLRGALEAGRVFTFEWRPSTDEVLRSANSASILGWPGDATHDTGEAFFARINSEDREAFVRLVSTLSPERAAYHTRYRYVRRDDGREVVLEESGSAVFDESGTMVCLRGLTHDITERTQAEETLRRAKELSQSLNRINESLHSTLDLGEVMQRLLAEGSMVLGSQTAAISLRQDDGWTVSHVHGMPASLRGTRTEDEDERHAVLAIESRRPIAVTDVLTDDRVNREHLRRYDIHAVLTLPLISREEPVGVIFFNYRDAPRAFTEAETDFAQQLATTATIAMENARLFDEHRRAEQALREAHKQAEWLARFPQENPNPVLRISADGRVLYRNPAAMELPAWGCEVGKPLPESLQPLVASALAEKKQVHQDVQLDGTFYAIYVAPVPSEGYANIYGRDITDLHQAHERLEMAQRAANAGVWGWDLATESIEWSPEMFELFGIDPLTATASFAAWESVLHPDDREIAAARIRQALAEHAELNSEYRIVRPDGEVRWINALGRGVYDKHARPVRMTGICIDISERKRAEEALRESHMRLKRVLEVETVGVMFWDLTTGCMTDANDAFLKMMGYSRREVEARELTWQKLTPPEYVDVSLAEIRKFEATGRVGPYEKEYFRRDGTRQWLLFAGSSLGGNACVEFCVDISDRKEAEEALAEAHRRTQGIIDNTTSIVYAFDLEERFILANAAVAKALNTTPEQLLGKRRHEFMPKEDADWHEANDRRVIEAGHAMEFEEHSELPGRSITWLTTKFPLRDRQGRIYAVAGISADISERKRAEEELRRRMEELRIANDELTRFNLAMVKRELRMIELKKEINELCLQAGLAARYRPDPEQKEKP